MVCAIASARAVASAAPPGAEVTMMGALQPLVLGDPARLRAEATAQADAPDGGAISIAATLK